MARPNGIGVALVGLALALAPQAWAGGRENDCRAAPSRRWQSVASGVWVWPGSTQDISPANRGHVTSQVLIARGKQATLIDPGPGLEHGKEVIRSARCEVGLEIDRVLDSHAHAENVLGNAAFRTRQGRPVAIESSAATRAAMAQRCEQCRAAIAHATANPALARTPILLPAASLQPGQRWDSDSGHWLTLEFSPAHSESDLAWWNAQQRVLIAPSLLYQDRLPELAQGSLLGWIAALRELAQLQPLWLVGNHPMSRAGLDATARYLCDLGQTVMQALQSGLSAAEASGIELPKYRHLPGYAERHGFNVQRAWRELEPHWIRGQELDCPAPD